MGPNMIWCGTWRGARRLYRGGRRRPVHLRWRGARPENLARLKQDYPTLQVIMLEQNYRSSARILGLANHLIANNPHVFEKRL